MLAGMNLTRTQPQPNCQTQKQNVPFGTSSAQAAKQVAKTVGKHTAGVGVIASTVIVDGFAAAIAVPLDILTGMITGTSRLLKKTGLIKNSINIPSCTMNIIQEQGAGIINFYEKMGLHKAAKRLGTKLW